MEAVSWLVSQISASLCFPVSLIDSQHINILIERWGYGSMGTYIYTRSYIYFDYSLHGPYVYIYILYIYIFVLCFLGIVYIYIHV